MIDLYTASTFNGRRVAIMLEETGLEYSTQWVDWQKVSKGSLIFYG